jgi:hypothetical protein
MDKYGFPRTSAKGRRTVKGFRTGDLVKAVVPKGKKQGTHVGRVAVRSSGSFNIMTAQDTIQGISYRHCRVLHRADGYLITVQIKSSLLDFGSANACRESGKRQSGGSMAAGQDGTASSE